ncbi:transcription antitermination factor NusB, partial [Myxococcota bacterium]|nr:transcription antitermination factor NusB [Myxococcota bacterium]
MSEAPETTGGSRHQGREVALQVLYAVDLGGHTSPRRPVEAVAAIDPEALGDAADGGDGDDSPPPRPMPTVEGSDRVFDRVAEHFSVPKGALDFARELVRGVVGGLPELDGLVSLHARNWRVSRMAVVDRNVLRLGAHELRDTDTPVAVVIDEAVDLARRFGSDRSPSF